MVTQTPTEAVQDPNWLLSAPIDHLSVFEATGEVFQLIAILNTADVKAHVTVLFSLKPLVQ